MILEYLQINRGGEYYFDASKPLTGKIKFRSNNGDEVAIRLTEDAAQKILAIVAEGMVDATKKIACDLTAEVITDQQRLTGSGEQKALS